MADKKQPKYFYCPRIVLYYYIFDFFLNLIPIYNYSSHLREAFIKNIKKFFPLGNDIGGGQILSSHLFKVKAVAGKIINDE